VAVAAVVEGVEIAVLLVIEGVEVVALGEYQT
jgi:hypothetical protein